MKMLLKGCRRCGGDLLPDGDDREGLTYACLQCGLSVRLVPVSRPFTLDRQTAPVTPRAA